MQPIDLEQFKVKHGGELMPAKSKRPPRHKAGEWFLKGPIPGEWLHRAAMLPGRALHVALAVWYAAGVGKCNQVRLTKNHLTRFGVKYDAGRRGLFALERVGLVTVDRHPGRCPIVTILEGPSGNVCRELGSVEDMPKGPD
jgi:hypothetical protein